MRLIGPVAGDEAAPAAAQLRAHNGTVSGVLRPLVPPQPPAAVPRKRKKNRRAAVPLEQIPVAWRDSLQVVDKSISLYTHRDAIIFDNSVTTVQMGLFDNDTPVAIKVTKRPVASEVS